CSLSSRLKRRACRGGLRGASGRSWPSAAAVGSSSEAGDLNRVCSASSCATGCAPARTGGGGSCCAAVRALDANANAKIVALLIAASLNFLRWCAGNIGISFVTRILCQRDSQREIPGSAYQLFLKGKPEGGASCLVEEISSVCPIGPVRPRR